MNSFFQGKIGGFGLDKGGRSSIKILSYEILIELRLLRFTSFDGNTCKSQFFLIFAKNCYMETQLLKWILKIDHE